MDSALFPDHLRPFSATYYPEPPRHLGRRYNRQGVFLPEAGNTVVCHLAPGSATESVLRKARRRFMAMPEAGKLAFTAETSLHMTLFQGIIDHQRQEPYWPADIDMATPVAAMTEIMAARLANFEAGAPFAVVLDHATPAGLTLAAASEADRLNLKSWRDRLADILGYRHPDHDDYRFHVTFSYMIERFDDGEMRRWQPMLREVEDEIRVSVPVLELKPPAFCAFADMHHFEELLVLEPARCCRIK